MASRSPNRLADQSERLPLLAVELLFPGEHPVSAAAATVLGRLLARTLPRASAARRPPACIMACEEICTESLERIA